MIGFDKIFCFGDGYAHGHIWPEWPQMLQALCLEHTVIIESAIGAGHEYLVHQLLQLDSELHGQAVVFQWPRAVRFDKLIEDQRWLDLAASDPVYQKNLYKNDSWWLSSSSHLPEIQKYHSFYVQRGQAAQRLADQQKLVQAYMITKDCTYCSTSTDHQESFSTQPRFSNTRGTQVQPAPLVHLEYVIEFVAPVLGINMPTHRVDKLRDRIMSHDWKPFDLNNQTAWDQMIIDID